MRILMLTSYPPYPPHQGAALRNFNLLRHLSSRHEVHLLSLVPADERWLVRGPLPELCASITALPAPRHTAPRRLRYALFSPLPDVVLRATSASARAALRDVTRRARFDVIQAENLEMSQYCFGAARPQTDSRVILDEHNAEHVLQRRAFRTDLLHPTKWPAALYSLVQWRKLRCFERQACRSADVVVSVSAADRRALLELEPRLDVRVVPNGVDSDYFAYNEKSAASFIKRPTIVFTGTMDFRPNVDGVLWFCSRVLPLLRRRVPELRLYIVGKRPSKAVLGLISEYVTVTGAVEDVRPYLRQATACVVPLRMGGGTRLKVLEAMSCGTPVVSTRVGVEGLEVQDGTHMLLADDPAGFAGRVLELIADRGRAHSLARAARALVEERYDWRHVLPLLEDVYAEPGTTADRSR